MQLESLKVFCDVARGRSISQAATANGVTQSAVSQTIAQLERRLNVQLFDRSTRPLQLTAVGKRYYDGCQYLLQKYLELEAEVRTASCQVKGKVQVAAIYSVGLGNMGQYVETFVGEHPDVEVHIDYLHPDQVYEKVLEGSADLGLVSFPRKSPKLAVTPWREETMVLACAKKSRLAARKSIRLSELANQQYVHFSRDLRIRRELDRFFRQNGVAVNVVLEFDNIENIKQAVEISAGVALLPEPTIEHEVLTGSLVSVALHGSHFARPLGIIYRKHFRLSQAARGFLELLQHNPMAPSSNGADHGTFAGGTEHRKNSKPIRSRNGSFAPTANGKQ